MREFNVSAEDFSADLYLEEKISGDFKYRINKDDTAEILEYLGTDKTVTTPPELEDYVVTQIGMRAFYRNTNIEKLIIGEGIENIDRNAFFGCENLTEVSFSNTLKVIDAGAFSYCSKLTYIDIPDSVYNIANNVFEGCTNLSNISAPENLVDLGYDTFKGTAWYNNQPEGLVYFGKALYSYKGECPATIEIAPNTRCIADCAFYWQSELTNIEIPNNVINIGADAFTGTKWLDNRNKSDKNIYAGKVLIQCDTSQSSLEIKEDTLGVSSFFKGPHENSFSKLTIPDSVKYIGRMAFQGCKDIDHIIIGNSVKVIGEEAFMNCESLKTVLIPPSVNEIGDHAFGFNGTLAGEAIWQKYCDNFIIYGYTGTEAERYAKLYDFTFVALDHEPDLGDTDNDGKITVKDATLIQKAVASIIKLDDTASKCADVNADGKVNIKDATAIQKFVAHIITGFDNSL